MQNFVRTADNFVIGNLVFIFALSIISAVQAIGAPGRIDFNFRQVLAAGADVAAVELQPDGKILAVGIFDTRGAVLQRDLVRLNADGTLDTSFSFGGTNNFGQISFIKLQTDGKILIAGNFNQINGQPRQSIARLNADGSLDTSFVLSGIDVTFVRSLDVQSDGRVLIGATNLIGSTFVTRLSPTGVNETGTGIPFFRPNISGSGSYKVTFVPGQNKILIGGLFTHYANQIYYRGLIRLNLDGTADAAFNPNITNSSQFDLQVNASPLAAGKTLVWGKFDNVGGTPQRNIVILNADGSPDAGFNPATLGGETILAAAVQSNGKIVIGGDNFPFNTGLRGNLARLNADGSIDSTFNQGKGAKGTVKTLKIRANNKLLIGGAFSRYQIFPRSGLAQLNL